MLVANVDWPAGWEVVYGWEGAAAGWRTVDGGEPPDLVLTTEEPAMAAWMWATIRGTQLEYVSPQQCDWEETREHVIRLPADVMLGDVLLLVFVYDDEHRRAADEVTRISLEAGMDD